MTLPAPAVDPTTNTSPDAPDTLAWLDRLINACDALTTAHTALWDVLEAMPADPAPPASFGYEHGSFGSIRLTPNPNTTDLDWIWFSTETGVTGSVHRTGKVEVASTGAGSDPVVLERLEEVMGEIAAHADSKGYFDAVNHRRTAFRLRTALEALVAETAGAHDKAATGRQVALLRAATLLPTDQRHIATEVLATTFTGTATQLHTTLAAATR